jgi:hypothetical protein
MKRTSYKTANSAQFFFSAATVSVLLFGINVGATQAGTFGGHADQISWVPSPNVSSASIHSDEITWNCPADNVIVFSHKDEISWTTDIQLAQN